MKKGPGLADFLRALPAFQDLEQSPLLNTFVALKGDATHQRWKVTATFRLQTGVESSVPCIRVRAPHCGRTVYYSEAEFERLFVRLDS